MPHKKSPELAGLDSFYLKAVIIKKAMNASVRRPNNPLVHMAMLPTLSDFTIFDKNHLLK